MKIIFNFHFYIFHWHELLSFFTDKTTETAINGVKKIENVFPLRIKKFFIIFCRTFFEFYFNFKFLPAVSPLFLTFLFCGVFYGCDFLFIAFALRAIKTFFIFIAVFISIRYFRFYIPLYFCRSAPQPELYPEHPELNQYKYDN